MATGNINCTISDRILHLNLNSFTNSDISACNDIQTCLSMQPIISSNINGASFKNSEGIEEFTNHVINEGSRQSSIDDNKNCENKQSSKALMGHSKDCYSSVDSNKNSLRHEIFDKHDSFAIFQAQNAMPEELFINVESDDEGIHSWRPNMSSNALCADIFFTPDLVCDDLQKTDHSSFKLTSELQSSPLELEFSSKLPPIQDFTDSKMDLSSLLQAQIAGLNNVKYETINAKRRISELKEEIQKLSKLLHEKVIVQRTLEVEKLREDNAQLRLECQCLCMEVDYYLKGKAPLGEIDETFYGGNSQFKKNASTSQDLAEPTTHYDRSDDLEDEGKWECPACTFANHPAINSCEMCQTPRSHRNHLLCSSDSKDTCFCHPKSDSS